MATATTAVAVSQVAVFGAIGVIVLIGLLIAKELLSASGSEKVKRFGSVASVAINPLLFAFSIIVSIRILLVLCASSFGCYFDSHGQDVVM